MWYIIIFILEIQRNFQNIYRYQEHTLDEKSEKILYMLSDTLTNPSNTYEALTDSYDLWWYHLKWWI